MDIREINISRKETKKIKALIAYPKLQVASETYINITFKIRPDKEMAEFLKEIENKRTEAEESKVCNLSKQLALYGKDIG